MWPIAGAVGANILGGMMGNAASAGDRDAAMGAINANRSLYGGISTPDIEKMKLALEQYQSAGNLNLGQEAATQIGGHDALQDVQVDPRLRAAQLGQLEQLAKLGQSGLSPDQVAQLKGLQNQAEQENQSRMQSILQDAQRRGMGTSQAAIAAQMQSGQSAANRQAMNANQQAGMAFQNALQARSQAANLGQNMEQQQYQQSANLANALNQREAYNTQQQANVGQRNIDRFNQAQQYNQQNNQQIANANTGQRNEQQAHNKGLAQQDFTNQMQRAGGIAGANTQEANALTNRANQTAGMWSGIGGAIGQGLLSYGMNSNKKPDVSGNV